MKKEIQTKTWKLTKLEYEMIASFLWCDINNVIEIYQRYSFKGLGCILLSNYYLIRNNLVMGKVKDLEKMITVYAPDGMEMLNYLFSSHFFIKDGNLYYSMNQLLPLNKFRLFSNRTIRKVNPMPKKQHTVFPEMKYMKNWYMKKVFNNMIDHVNKKLPNHIKNEIMEKHYSSTNFNVENFYRIINAYISIDSSFIGFSDMLEIQLKILHRDKEDVKKVLAGSKVWVYDSRFNIVYDPIQRAANKMDCEPGLKEVMETNERRLERYIYILNLN